MSCKSLYLISDGTVGMFWGWKAIVWGEAVCIGGRMNGGGYCKEKMNFSS